MSVEPPRKSWRRSFSLRSLLVAISAIAILCLFVSRKYHDWDRQERARRQRAELLNMGDFPGDIPLRPRWPLSPAGGPEPRR